MRADCQKQGIDFDPLDHCGHRYSNQVLPTELIDCHLAWSLCDGNAAAYFELIQTKTLLEILEALALKLASAYLREE